MSNTCTKDYQALGLLGYLAVPNFIFGVSWLDWPISIAFILVLAGLLATLRQRCVVDTVPAGISIATASVCAILWAALSGGSHFFHADHDWAVRDAMLGDLVRHPWPVLYQLDDGTSVLRSAFGYFLPPALVGKQLGFGWLGVATYAWTVLGLILFFRMLPVPSASRLRGVAIVALVIVFSGMDIVGIVIATQDWPIFPLRLEWWVPLSYPSMTGQLIWAPNHCLPAWLLTVLLWRYRNSAQGFSLVIGATVLTVVWTPFAAISILPFVLVSAASMLRRHGRKLIDLPVVMASTVLALPLMVFFTIDLFSVGTITLSAATTDSIPTSNSVAYRPFGLSEYLLFIICEFACLGLALWRHRIETPMFVTAVTVLICLPLIRFGTSNDALIRICAPALVILLITAIACLNQASHISLMRRLAVVTIVMIGSLTAFHEIWRTISFSRQPPNYASTLADSQAGRVAGHYAARLPNSSSGWMTYQLVCTTIKGCEP